MVPGKHEQRDSFRVVPGKLEQRDSEWFLVSMSKEIQSGPW